MKEELKLPKHFYEVLNQIKKLEQEKHELRKILFNDLNENSYQETFTQNREIELIVFCALLKELDYSRESLKRLKDTIRIISKDKSNKN